MINKSIFVCSLLLALISTNAFGNGFLNEQYLALRYQHGEFGNSHDSSTMDSTKGAALTYNHPAIENIDLGASIELNWADGREIVGGNKYDIDFMIGGVVSYATWTNSINPYSKFFMTPQLGFQRTSLEVKKAGQNQEKDENNLFLGLDSGIEFTIDRVVITPAFSVSRANNTSFAGKLGIGFNITDWLILTVGGLYQLNDHHDYMATAGFAFRF